MSKLSKETQQKLLCLSGLCQHGSLDKDCLFAKFVDKNAEALFREFEKIIEKEMQVRKPNGKTNRKKISK